jgi:hypothetical protein
MRSADGGPTFSAPKPGPDFDLGPRGPRRLRTVTNFRAAIDTGKGKFADRIYVTWIEYENDRYSVRLAHTDDAGVTWSKPVTVNDNDGPHDSSNAAVAVNADGIVALVWNDRRNDPKGECFRVYATASLDGGDTFLPNEQVNAHSTCPEANENWSGMADGANQEGNRFADGGETQRLAAGPDGRFHIIWINGKSGVMQLSYTAFTVLR